MFYTFPISLYNSFTGTKYYFYYTICYSSSLSILNDSILDEQFEIIAFDCPSFTEHSLINSCSRSSSFLSNSAELFAFIAYEPFNMELSA